MIRKYPNDHPGLLQHFSLRVAIFAMNLCLCIIFPCFMCGFAGCLRGPSVMTLAG